MKWYGFLKTSKNSLIYKKKKNYKYHFKQSALFVNKKINLNYTNLILHFPSDWNFLILSQSSHFDLNHLYLYNSFYFFKLPLFTPFMLLKYDSQTNSLVFKFLLKNSFFGIFWNLFKKIFFSFTKVFFRKLKFKGKGYYIYKNFRNTIAMQLGYSHLTYLYAFFVSVKFLTKTSILMFGLNNKDIWRVSKMLHQVKSINIFTGKGIRFSRQIVYRKTGKVSSYR
jgi:ribosomal protein L6P/L9E